jgi:N-acetylglucosamine-6-sulfatase
MSEAVGGESVPGKGGWSRRTFLKGLGAAGIVAPAALTACSDDESGSSEEQSSTTTRVSPRKRRDPSDDRPNFIVIVADDMRYDQLWSMSKVIELIQKPGRTFTQARCNVPLCQPSRVGMFTGQLSKHHGVIEVGLFPVDLSLDSLVSKSLGKAGYACGLTGKFINAVDAYGGTDPPPGFSFWREILLESDSDVFKIRTEDDVVQPKDIYPTDYYAQEAISFMDNVQEPFALWMTPVEPHSPFTPRADHADLFADYEFEVPEEDDVSDKPPWIQELAALTPEEVSKIQQDARGSLRELAAVDDMVGQVIGALDPEVLARTVVIFTSDNGMHRGEHRRRGAATKSGPYEEGLHVPMVVRGPGFDSGPEVAAPVLMFQDIAATMIALAGAEPVLDHQAGSSLVDIVTDPDSQRQRVLLHEIGDPYYDATGDGITTGPGHDLGFRKLYRYPSVRSGDTTPPIYEAYDLDADPNELQNWADDPSRRAERDRLETLLDGMLSAP